ncbi:MAG TPA: CocE/NonD family hydrolase [Fimbriimonas sp.]|nr:CocE/NonD family hydrolase [Fimbriimonas sp.]
MLACFVLAILSLAAFSEDRHYTITIGGRKVGDSTLRGSTSTGLAADSHLKIGNISIDESLSAKFSGKSLVYCKSVSKSPRGTTTLLFKDGKVTVDAGTVHKVVPYKAKVDLLGANLIPALWTSSLNEAKRQMKLHPTQKSVTVSAYLPDLGSELPIKIQTAPSRTLGRSVFSAFKLTLGGVLMECDADSQGNVVALEVPSQKLRFILDGYDKLFTDALAKYPELSQETFETKSLDAVRVKMRDGVELATDITLPTVEGQYPVVLERTPYGRGLEATAADFYAKRGYVYVIQDCRGRGDSGGEWDPFVHEGDDGYDTIQWIASQPWSNGKVGMIGGSYGGYVQWAAAVKNPPALKCIVPQVSPPDAMHNLPYEFGVPFLYADVWWAKIVMNKDADLLGIGGPMANADKLVTLPLGKVDEKVLGRPVPFLRKWFARTTSKDWKGFDFLDHIKEANVPALHISGWWDGDGIGTKLNWAAERHLGRHDQWLIEGPWSHAFNSSSSIGKVDYGDSAVIDLDSLYIRWFDTWLKGKEVGLEKTPRVLAFVTGANVWMGLRDWPDKVEKARTLYLSPGALSSRLSRASQDRYTYDPAKDVQIKKVLKEAENQGGFTGEVKNSSDPNRKFLVYRSAPLTHSTAIAGPATVDLYFKTSARDTDLFASIIDIDEKGRMFAVDQEGKIRGSYLSGVDKIRPLTPGKVYKAHILPWDFAHEFKKGHRIGLVITSTLFPVYARNLGTAGPILTGTRMIAQHNALLFGAKTPSNVTFQVLYEK